MAEQKKECLRMKGRKGGSVEVDSGGRRVWEWTVVVSSRQRSVKERMVDRGNGWLGGGVSQSAGWSWGWSLRRCRSPSRVLGP